LFLRQMNLHGYHERGVYFIHWLNIAFICTEQGYFLRLLCCTRTQNDASKIKDFLKRKLDLIR
jgi:hypothetical protein